MRGRSFFTTKKGYCHVDSTLYVCSGEQRSTVSFIAWLKYYGLHILFDKISFQYSRSFSIAFWECLDLFYFYLRFIKNFQIIREKFPFFSQFFTMHLNCGVLALFTFLSLCPGLAQHHIECHHEAEAHHKCYGGTV